MTTTKRMKTKLAHGAFANLRAWPTQPKRIPSERHLRDAYGDTAYLDAECASRDALAVLREAFATTPRVTFRGEGYAYTIERVGASRTRVTASDGSVFWITAVTDLLLYDARWADVLCDAAHASRVHESVVAGRGPDQATFEGGKLRGDW